MKRAFIIVTVEDRVEQLNQLVRSIRKASWPERFELFALFQGTTAGMRQIERPECFAGLWRSPARLGCHAARVLLLQLVLGGAMSGVPDVFVNLDDDMELVGGVTNYERSIERALHPMTGFVLTNWARTEAQLQRKIPKMRDAFVRQVLVYQGGGMVYRREVAEMMAQLPPVPQTFDHSWPLTAYINGLTNFRYLGSLAIHRVCGVGGMQSYMAENPPAAMMAEYVRFRRAKIQRGDGRDLLIPLDDDLTELAHQTHDANRERRLAAMAPSHA